MTLLRLALPAVSGCLVSGCVATVVQSPRVEPGAQLGVVGTLVAGANDSNGSRLTSLPDVGFYLSGGFVDRNFRRPAFRVTGQMSVMTGYAVDLYGQVASRPDAWTGGLGVLLQGGVRRSAAPYVAVARPVAEGLDLYAVQQLMFTSPTDTQITSTLGITTVGLRWAGGRRGAVLVTGVFGHLHSSCHPASNWCRALALRTRVMVGVSREFELQMPARRPTRGRRAT